VTVEAPESLPPLSAAVEAAAYRIVLEALTNVTRHAHAQTCHIRLVLGEALEVEVLDDGRGLPAAQTAGVGLISIHERTEELGGRCLVERVAGGGTRVWACLPVSSPAVDATPEARGQE
jgi:signal transduction histidine kinase